MRYANLGVSIFRLIACADRTVLDEFRTALLQCFEGTYEGEVHTYLGCEIMRELEASSIDMYNNDVGKESAQNS